jgi:hypothetical protein
MTTLTLKELFIVALIRQVPAILSPQAYVSTDHVVLCLSMSLVLDMVIAIPGFSFWAQTPVSLGWPPCRRGPVSPP